MKPFIHAELHAKKFGGKPEEYIHIDNFLDSSKAHVADVRHRALFHNSFGPFIVEQVFGLTFVNSEGKIVSTRDVAEDHILQDLGKIPTVSDWLRKMPVESWMGKPVITKKTLTVSCENEALENAARVD